MNYVRSLGESIRKGVDQTLLPEGDTTLLFDLYALLALTRGETTTAAEVHHAWVVWMLTRGLTHEAMVPFEKLSLRTKAEDEPFAEAIRAAAALI